MTMLPGEHPDLPELVVELFPAIAGGRYLPARPAYVRWLLSPLRVMTTADPARLRRHAHRLLAAADLLELEHERGVPGQQELEVGALA